MGYTVLVAVVLALTSGSMAKAFYSRKEKSSPYLFTALSALFSGAFFFCYNGFRFDADRHTVLLSVAFAVCYLACDVTTLLAMGRGSIAISSMISSFSLLLPTLFGIVYWHESTNPLFWIGVLLFCVSVVLVNISGSTGQEKRKTDFLWIVFVTVMFFANGGCSIFQTYHQRTGGENFKAEFMIIAMAFVFVINSAIALFTLKKSVVKYCRTASIFSLIYGLLNGGVNLGVMLLASGGELNQSVFFPVISIGSLVLILIASIVFFKEKLSKVQYAGIAVGIASIVLLQV